MKRSKSEILLPEVAVEAFARSNRADLVIELVREIVFVER